MFHSHKNEVKVGASVRILSVPEHFAVMLDTEEGVSDAKLAGVVEFQQTLSIFIHFTNAEAAQEQDGHE